MDGDASPEALLGLPTDDESGDSAGAVWLVSGPFEGTHDLSVKGTKLVGESKGDMLGFVVAHGGDQSGDGLDDPVIQAWGYDDYAGALYVLDGLVR